MEPVLSIRNLTVHFQSPDSPTVRAVQNLSYDLYPGQILGVVGESGSGKSVHALSILRLLPQPPAQIVSGEILYRGLDLLKLPQEKIRNIRGNKISMIFQEPMTSLNPVLTIGEQIAEAVVIHRRLPKKEALQHAVSMLERVGIPDAARRIRDYPHQFSGGQRQRVMIAMSLALNPDILIADEPTTALDVTIQAQILELLRQLQREMQMAVILITHNLGVIHEIATQALVLYAGCAQEEAAPRELLRHPGHPYTLGLLRSIPQLDGPPKRLEPIAGHPPELWEKLPACHFADRCSFAQELCRTEEPPWKNLNGHHRTHCWIEDPAYPQPLRERARREGLKPKEAVS